MTNNIEAWTDLAVDPEELRALHQAMDEVGLTTHYHDDEGLPLVEVMLPVWIKGVKTTLALTIEEDSIHARERLNDEAGLADAAAIAETQWRQ